MNSSPSISFETFRRIVISAGFEFDEALKTCRALGLTDQEIEIYSTQE
jgi:hypothetical protein